MAKWKEESLANYREKVESAISRHEMVRMYPYLARIHTGMGNTKTGMANEGTSSGSCGSCDPSCEGDCESICYVMTHVDGVRPLCLEHHAENLQARRADPLVYYITHFTRANFKDIPLRVNETGDFESEEDIKAFYRVASEFSYVKVIGYTKRESLLPWIRRCNELPNVQLHYSLACKHKGEETARRLGVPCTKITTDIRECGCPAQKLPKGKWHCRDCANRGCGCFSNKDIAFMAH